MLSKNFSNIIFKTVGHKTIQFVKPITYRKSTADTRKIYDEIGLDYVLGPPFTLHAAIPKLMAGVWSLVRETLIVNRNVNRLTKEAVAGGVSISNECPFCVQAHINMSGGETDTDREDIFTWSKSHYEKESDLIMNPPFSEDEAPEIIGTALAFHYINRMVTVFVTDFPLPLPRYLNFLKPAISSFFKLTAAKNITGVSILPGASLKRVPNAVLPKEFSWAQSNADISASFAGFDLLINAIGKKEIPSDVQKSILLFISTWDGVIQVMGNQWLEKEIATLSDDKKSLARLILLIAIQPYKITEQHIDELRALDYSDEQLIAVCAWGSWQATKQISSWISQ